MNELQVFENREFGQVRTIMKDGEPWFVAADVCRALELGNPTQAISRLDEDEKGNTLISNEGNRGNPNVSIVNESGLYALVLGSRKPEARAFKRWITHEVIPAIRKHGGYLTQEKVEEALLNPDVLIRLATELKEERTARMEAETQKKLLAAKIEQDKPYTQFGSAIAANSDAILVGEFAKLACNSGINIGQKRLFAWLRENGYLQKDNKPYQRYIDNGWFALRESSITTVNGNLLRSTTLITGKGQMALLERLTAHDEA